MAASVTLITGAASGIGEATAHAFAGAVSHRLALVDLAWDDADSADREHLAADVTDADACQRVVDLTVDRFGRLDNLVNVVGGNRPGKTVLDLDLDEWNQLLALNLTSTFLMSRAALPDLETHGGNIVNLSSDLVVRGMRADPVYMAAKAGVVGLTRALAIDHGPRGVRVNAVAPGATATPPMRRNTTPDELAAMGNLSIGGRVGDPDDVAAVILWLCGDGASYVMGQTIDVNGGPAPLI